MLEVRRVPEDGSRRPSAPAPSRGRRMIARASAGAKSPAMPSAPTGRGVIRRRRCAELALLAATFCMAGAALAGPAILVTR